MQLLRKSHVTRIKPKVDRRSKTSDVAIIKESTFTSAVTFIYKKKNPVLFALFCLTRWNFKHTSHALKNQSTARYMNLELSVVKRCWICETILTETWLMLICTRKFQTHYILWPFYLFIYVQFKKVTLHSNVCSSPLVLYKVTLC